MSNHSDYTSLSPLLEEFGKQWEEAGKRLQAEDKRRKLLQENARERKLAAMSPSQRKDVERWESLTDKGRKALKLRNPWEGTAHKSKAAEYNEDEVYAAEQVTAAVEMEDRVIYRESPKWWRDRDFQPVPYVPAGYDYDPSDNSLDDVSF